MATVAAAAAPCDAATMEREHQSALSTSTIRTSSSTLLSRASLYARTLMRKAAVSVLSAGPLPSHVAFIMDGNRRFAESRLQSKDPREGHVEGYKSLVSALEWCLDLGIQTVSVFAFSVDNFSRPKEEVDALMELAREKLGELAGGGRGGSEAAARPPPTTEEEEREREDGGALLRRHGVRLKVLGDLSLLPEAVAEAARAAERATEKRGSGDSGACTSGRLFASSSSSAGEKARLNVCLSYASRRELADAISKMASAEVEGQGNAPPPSPTTPLAPSTSPSSASPSSAAAAAITASEASKASPLAAAATVPPSPSDPATASSRELIDAALYTAGCPPVDLLVRTSGESRLSDFLLWQSRHASLAFSPRLWPELRFVDVARAVVAYQRAHPKLEALRRRAAEASAEGGRAGGAAAAATHRADGAPAAAASAPAPAPLPPAAPLAPPPPAAPARGPAGGGVPRRVRGSRPAADAFPPGAAERAVGGEPAPTAPEAPAEPPTCVPRWASRDSWRTRRGDNEFNSDEEGVHAFDPRCPCCLTTGGRLIDGDANEERNLKMPDGLEEAMLAKKRREAEVRAAMARERKEREERERREKEEGEGKV